MKIAIAGLSYVGLSNAALLAQHNEVVAIDIAADKVAMLNRNQSTIEDAEIKGYLQHTVEEGIKFFVACYRNEFKLI